MKRKIFSKNWIIFYGSRQSLRKSSDMWCNRNCLPLIPKRHPPTLTHYSSPPPHSALIRAPNGQICKLEKFTSDMWGGQIKLLGLRLERGLMGKIIWERNLSARVGEKAANSLNHICQCFINTKAKLRKSLSLRLNFDSLANKEGIFFNRTLRGSKISFKNYFDGTVLNIEKIKRKMIFSLRL